MINIFRSLFLSLIGLGPFAVISIFFISSMIVGVGPESALATYFGDYIINSESLADAGDDFQDVANYLFKLFFT